jgi:hypothetical protein
MARAFYVIVVDHDLKVCSIHRPLTDDTAWGVAVVDARRKGRSVQLADASSSLQGHSPKRKLAQLIADTD